MAKEAGAEVKKKNGNGNSIKSVYVIRGLVRYCLACIRLCAFLVDGCQFWL